MRSIFAIILCTLSTIFFSAIFAAAKTTYATEIFTVSGSPRAGAVLLKTGFFFEGILTSNATHITIQTDYGEIRFPQANIEYVGADSRHIYLYKYKQVLESDIQGFLALGDWCVQNDLKNEAKHAFSQALALADNPKTAQEISSRIDALRITMIASENAPENKSEKTFSENEDELRKWAETVPLQVREQFVRKVQPILMARCAVSDCHGSGCENDFRLTLPRIHPQATLINMRASLQQVDLIDPLESPLVAHPRTATHGGSRPLFSRAQQNQLNALVQWSDLAAMQVSKNVFDQLIAEKEKSSLQQNATQILLQNFSKHLSKHTPQNVARNATPQVEPVTLRSAVLFEPRATDDPFDPNIFNTMYHARTISSSVLR